MKQTLVAFEGVVFSTFFSPGERACLKTVLSGAAGVVWVAPMALPEQIPAAWTDAFLDRRALWVSEHDMADASRASCEQANQQVKRFCELRTQGSGAACLRAETHRQATKDPRCLGNAEPQNKEY